LRLDHGALAALLCAYTNAGDHRCAVRWPARL
jgi:hypothetical protein